MASTKKPPVRLILDSATVQRRRQLKSAQARNKESIYTLKKVMTRCGGTIETDENSKTFVLRFTGLNLQELPIELFEDEFVHEKCVRELVGIDASKNKLHHLDSKIGEFENLKFLHLPKNRLRQLPASICQLHLLRELDITYNELVILPQSIYKCSSLTIIKAEHNKLRSVPFKIGLIPNLTMLDIANNNITKVPNTIYHVTKVVNISGNQVRSLPEVDMERKSKHSAHHPHSAAPDRNCVCSIEAARNKIASLPANISVLTELQCLNLASNNLTGLPDAVGQLSRLIALNLFENKLETIPESMEKLRELRVLDLRNNHLVRIPEGMSNMRQLLTLDCGGNVIENIPAAFSDMENLQSVDWSENKIQAVPDLAEMPHLVTMDLSQNSIASMGEVSEMASIQKLDLSQNQLTEIPESLGDAMHSLKTVLLANNELERIPKSLGNIRDVNTLDLSSNRLSSLDRSIRKMRNLQNFSAHGNQLSKLPQPFGFMRSLRDVDLSNNQFQMAAARGRMPATIKSLNLRGNELGGEIPTRMFMEMKMLVSLDVSSANLNALPASIGRLRMLQNLDLSDNNILKLPPTSGNMVSLRSVKLSKNKFTSMPEHMTSWKRLTELDVAHNEIKELPSSKVIELNRLSRLDASHNQIASIDEHVFSDSSLEIIHLNDNRIENVDSDDEGNESARGDATRHVCLREVNLGGNLLTESTLPSMNLFSTVTHLMIDRNRLEMLPTSIDQLKFASHLNFSNNMVKQIPKSIESLKNLRELYMANNLIEKIPVGLRRCRSLAALDLSGNAVTQVPAPLMRLKFLKTLKMDGNPLEKELPPRFRVKLPIESHVEEPKLPVQENVGVSTRDWIKSLKASISKPKEAKAAEEGVQRLSEDDTSAVVEDERSEDTQKVEAQRQVISKKRPTSAAVGSRKGQHVEMRVKQLVEARSRVKSGTSDHDGPGSVKWLPGGLAYRMASQDDSGDGGVRSRVSSSSSSVEMGSSVSAAHHASNRDLAGQKMRRARHSRDVGERRAPKSALDPDFVVAENATPFVAATDDGEKLLKGAKKSSVPILSGV